MSRHTAPEELLLDYAAGALAQGPALAVALHVALDPAARRAVERLDAMGGALIEGEAGAAVDDAALERTLARLDKIAVEPRHARRRRRSPAILAPTRAGGACLAASKRSVCVCQATAIACRC
jgi:putative transcriptional regulator